MGMFDKVKGMLGIISVREQNGLVTITGVPSRFISGDINYLWGTSKIATHMFKNVKPSEFSFYSFFALEIEYMFKKMLEDKTRYCSRRVLARIIELMGENTWLREREEQWGDIVDLNKTKPVKFKLLPGQDSFIRYYNHTKPRYQLRGSLFAGDPGSGKAQPLDAFIRTPSGWTTMGEIRLGDLVSTPDGGSASVIGVYPQGIKDVYCVTFSDGRSTECCGEHLWTIYNRNNGRGQWETVNTFKLIELLSVKDARIYIPLVKPEIKDDVKLPVDPYLIGALIGDGTYRHDTVGFSSADQFIIDEIKTLINDELEVVHRAAYDYGIRRKAASGPNSLKQHLRNLGLDGCYSYEKTIPWIYTEGSLEQKLSLLQGLMDTDGYVGVKGGVSFCTTSYKLALQVEDLIRSIGGMAKIAVKSTHYTHDGNRLEGRIAYNINIRYHKPSDLFRLPRKKERCIDDGQYNDTLKLAVKSVELVSAKECQCIMVDHPEHLYITNAYVVTHNTIGGIATMLARDKDYVFVIAPKKAIYDVWEKTLLNAVTGQSVWVADTNTACPKGTKWMIFHYERLDQALDMAKSLNLPNAGVILDESHNLNMKSKESIRTNLFLEMCKVSKSEDVLWLSGTALTAMGSEAIPLFRCLIDNFTPEAEQAMRKIWGKVGGKANDILANRLGIISFIIPQSSYMTDKPIEATIKIRIPNGNRYTLESIRAVMTNFINERFAFYKQNKPVYQRIYDDAIAIHKKKLITPRDHARFKEYTDNVNTFIKYGYDPMSMSPLSTYCNDYELNEIIPSLPQPLRAPFKDARSVIKYVELKIKGECLGNILGKERTQCHVDMVRHIPFQMYIDNALKKTLIFTDFIPVLEETRKYCAELGFMPVVVYGDTNKDLEAIIKDFRANPDVNPCVATFRSLAEAVPLTEANNGMMLNKPFRFHHYKQAMARMHRIGQVDPVNIWNFVLDTGSEPNISTRSEDIMNWSRDQVDQLMGYDRYGSTINVPDADIGHGLESADDGIPPFEIEEGFLSAGNEALYNMLETEGLLTENPPESIQVPRSKAMQW